MSGSEVPGERGRMLDILAIAIGPAAAILWWILSRDRTEPEPAELLWGTVGLGAASSIYAILLELLADAFGPSPNDNPETGMALGAALIAALFIGLAEESGKLFAVLILPFRRREFNQYYDGIVYCVAASLGFATLENILYVSMSGLMGGVIGAYVTGFSRALTAVPVHAGTGVLMGMWVGAAKMVPKRRTLYILVGFGAAVTAHALYDAVLFTRSALSVLFVPILLGVIAVSLWGIRKARRADESYSLAFWSWRADIDHLVRQLHREPRKNTRANVETGPRWEQRRP